MHIVYTYYGEFSKAIIYKSINDFRKNPAIHVWFAQRRLC